MAAPTPRLRACTTTSTRASPDARAASAVPSELASSTTTIPSTQAGIPSTTRPMRGASCHAGTTATIREPCHMVCPFTAMRRWPLLAVGAFLAVVLLVGGWFVARKPFPPDTTPEGAYARIAFAVAERRTRDVFPYLETDAQWASF